MALLHSSFILSAFAFENGDFQLWNTESIEAKLDKHWKAKIEEELRFGDDISELYYTHTDGGLTLNVTEGLALGINYRQVFEKSDDEWKEEYRPHANATISWKWLEYNFKNRCRLEYRMRENKDDAWRYRDKLTVKFPWKWTDLKIQPYIADEIFVDFYGKKVNRNRLYAGFGAKLFKHLKTDIFYLWQTSKVKIGKWTNYNVLGIKFKAVF